MHIDRNAGVSERGNIRNAEVFDNHNGAVQFCPDFHIQILEQRMRTPAFGRETDEKGEGLIQLQVAGPLGCFSPDLLLAFEPDAVCGRIVDADPVFLTGIGPVFIVKKTLIPVIVKISAADSIIFLSVGIRIRMHHAGEEGLDQGDLPCADQIFIFMAVSWSGLHAGNGPASAAICRCGESSFLSCSSGTSG